MPLESHIIYGPPGTGKSTELLRRMKAEMDRGVPDRDICFVSFTKAAAKELTSRAGLKNANISTIHSLAFRCADIRKEQVVSREELKRFSRLVGIDISGANPEENEFASVGDYYLSLYSLHRSTLSSSLKATYERSRREGELQEFVFFAEKYEEFKRAYGYIDFSDMLDMALDFPAPKFTMLFVDEAQDLSHQQWRLIDHWVKAVRVLHVAGDPDQLLFFWSGADKHGMKKFEEKYGPECTILGQSYRIPSSVHGCATQILTHIKDRKDVKYFPREFTGMVRKHETYATVPLPEHGEDVLFLYRNHSLRGECERLIIEMGLPYSVESGKYGFFHSPLARAYRSLCKAVGEWKKFGEHRLAASEKSNLSRHCPTFKHKIESKDMSFAIGKRPSDLLTGDPDVMRYVTRVATKYGMNCIPTIRLSTIHGAKGREADRVVLLNSMSFRTMESAVIDPDSEARTFYVGVTRAKKELDIVYGENPAECLR